MQAAATITERASPERTCAGCRGVAPQADLLRFSVGEAPPYLAADPARRLGGRGVSVHPRRACLAAAVRHGAFSRAARRRITASADALAAQAVEQYRRRVEGLLVAAHRSRAATVGTDAVREAMHAPRLGQGALLVVSEDAAGRRDELVASADRLGTACVVFGTKASLGRVFGRGEVAIVLVTDRGIAASIVETSSRMAALSEKE